MVNREAFLYGNAQELVEIVRELHFAIRTRAMEQMSDAKKSGSEELSHLYGEVFGDELFQKGYGGKAGDVMYKIDVGAEEILGEFCTRLSKDIPHVLISEATGVTVYPNSTRESDCYIRMIADIIDGTRLLMYDMGPAFSLTGLAPNNGPKTTLQDIEIAVQTEIPTTKQYLADLMYAVRGQYPIIEEWDVLRRTKVGQRAPRPSMATTIEHGFAMLTKFFRGKDVSTDLEETVFREILGSIEYGKADVFEHQYIPTAGQLAYLINGKYRFCADLRPWTERFLQLRGDELGLCAHPYDLCTKLIAEEAGVIVTDEKGLNLNAPLDTTTNVAWLGYANQDIRQEVEGPLMKVMHEFEARNLNTP